MAGCCGKPLPIRQRYLNSWLAFMFCLVAACGTEKPSAVQSKDLTASQPATPPPTSTSPPDNSADRETPLLQTLKHEKWHGDLDAIAKRRILRVLVVPSKLGFYFDG